MKERIIVDLPRCLGWWPGNQAVSQPDRGRRQPFSLCPLPPGPGGTGPSNTSGIASGGTGSTPSHRPGNAKM